MRKWKPLILILLLALNLFLWWPITPLCSLTESEEIEIIGCEKSSVEYFIITKALEKMTPAVRKSLTAIEVSGDPGIYGATGLARCYPISRKIFIKPDAVLKEGAMTVWHESAHAHNFYLDYIWTFFSLRWEKIKGGVLTDYGEKSPMEDTADWVMHFYLAANGYLSEFDHFETKIRILENPKPFKEKLELLREYEFVGEGDYRKFLETHGKFF